MRRSFAWRCERWVDLADISRLVEAFAELRRRVPEDVLSRLI